METRNESVTIRLHHSGHFLKTKYSGGLLDTQGMDPDLFSYTVLMEFVKDLKYKEIGGIYVSKGKNGGWKLVTDDKGVGEYIKGLSEFDFYIDCNVDKARPIIKQMQPHVIVRPRASPLKAIVKNVEKRTFVTLKDINDEKERKICTRKKLQFNHVAARPTREGTTSTLSLDQEKVNGTLTGELVSLGEYLTKFAESGGSKETEIAGVEVVKEFGDGNINAYEMNRNKNVAENKAKIFELGLARNSVERNLANLCGKDKGNKAGVTNDDDSESAYFPNTDVERQSDEDDIVTSKKTKKVKRQRLEIGDGPRTRSRVNIVADSCEKEAAAGSLPVEENNAPVVSLKEKLKNLKEGPGSMIAYLKSRENEKIQLQTETPQAESETHNLQSQSDTPVNEAIKRKRGKTKMDHVHNRTEKKQIYLNARFQAVSENRKARSELGSFLGTAVRQFVSVTCASWHEVPQKELLWQYVKDKYSIPDEGKKWVLKSMNDQFRSHKSRLKRDHYYPFSTDEERLAKRPRDVALEHFKILLKYWGDEKVEETARKNKVARSKVTETHTAGPTSFAQVSKKLELEKIEKMMVAGDGEEEPEEPAPISDADIYIETRKRADDREYKLREDDLKAVKAKIVNVKKALQDEGVEAANKLVHGGKEHHPSWLIGRLVRNKEPKSKSSSTSCDAFSVPDHYVSDLTAKIRAQLQEEMDEKLDQKVREMMQKLSDQNPDLKLKLDDSKQSSEMSPSDDNVTP